MPVGSQNRIHSAKRRYVTVNSRQVRARGAARADPGRGFPQTLTKTVGKQILATRSLAYGDHPNPVHVVSWVIPTMAYHDRLLFFFSVCLTSASKRGSNNPNDFGAD
jgi:hypothetical protein